MTRDLATVSIIIPTFNGARYLLEAVASARRQTRPPDEIIIVDDGSTDETPAIVEGLDGAVVALKQRHQGAGAARNHGVEAAHGDYLAFLDADDLFVPTKLAHQIAHLDREGGPDISFGHVEEFVATDLPPEQTHRLRPRAGARAGGVPGAMLIARDVFNRVGPFESSLRVGEFADWYLKALDAGLRVETLDDVVLRRRLHGDNISVRERTARVDFARIMKRALDRRRQAADDPAGR